uniref:Uncharacterized protein n=1 Tax=Timema tahoe TaxID=61484 RepID=A0A7R9NWE3_9NEOP|nr:unnamed protein product [Timema tahoe]
MGGRKQVAAFPSLMDRLADIYYDPSHPAEFAWLASLIKAKRDPAKRHPDGVPYIITTVIEAINHHERLCTRKVELMKPLAITSIFNTLFPLDEVDSKRVIVGMIVKKNFMPYVHLEKCGGDCASFNRTDWQELVNYKSVISKIFINTQPPQKSSLTNHESSLRRMCGDHMVVTSEKQDAGLKRVAYLAPSWSRLCDVWDLIDVTVDDGICGRHDIAMM